MVGDNKQKQIPHQQQHRPDPAGQQVRPANPAAGLLELVLDVLLEADVLPSALAGGFGWRLKRRRHWEAPFVCCDPVG